MEVLQFKFYEIYARSQGKRERVKWNLSWGGGGGLAADGGKISNFYRYI